MKNYIKVTYKDTPYTEYPHLLMDYLVKRFEIQKTDTFLDLGCGRGDFLNATFTHVNNVYGIDRVCEDKVIHANNGDKIYIILEADLEKTLPFDDKSFGIVFCKSVIEHFHYPEKLVAEVRRILKPDGLFIVMTPDWESTKQAFYNDFTHRSPFTLNSLREILEIHDFEIVACEKFRQLPWLWKKPHLNFLCDIAQLFYRINTKDTIIKYSKEKMLLGVGMKNEKYE